MYTNWVPRVLKLWVFQWVITAECKCSSSEPLVTFYDQQPQNCLLQLPTGIANMRDLNWCPFVFTLHSKVHWFPIFALDSCSAKTWHEFRLFHWYQRWMTTRWQVICVEIWTTPFRQGYDYICLPFILECNTVDAAPVITLGLFNRWHTLCQISGRKKWPKLEALILVHMLTYLKQNCSTCKCKAELLYIYT